MLDALGWKAEDTCVRRYSYGLSLALSAPIDALYASCEVSDWLWSESIAVLEGRPAQDIEEAATVFRQTIATEANPAVLALRDAAATHGLAFLSDDEDVSVGLGRGSITWPVQALPVPHEVQWHKAHDIPLALVTGTNGKTTTTRMVASMLAAAGRTVGLTSTDGIRVAGELVESGDFSGPSGARTVLRDRRVETAVLETARGGLLRRGLGVERADAVAITTIAEDHLGDFGSRTVEELLMIKWVLTRAISGSSELVLNADEPRLVEMARQARAPITWFSLDANHPVVRRHVEENGRAAVLDEGELVIFSAGQPQTLCKVDEVPLTLVGAARHNISNALAATGLALALGISTEAIVNALRSASFEDNPGRCNLFQIGGKQVVVDFAHNPQAMQAVFDLARALPARRRLLSFGQAGDRPDEAIDELASKAWAIGLDRVHIVELPKYERGRQPGEVCALLRSGLINAGAPTSSIHQCPTEQDSLTAALEWAEPGDLVLVMALANSAEIVDRLQKMSARSQESANVVGAPSRGRD
jgi:cyanophycin synthetase